MSDVVDLDQLSALVIIAAREELLPRFTTTGHTLKRDGSVVTEADLAMQQRIESELAARWPQFKLLGEEMEPAAQQALLAAPGEGLWCLDPLDGTSNFASGIPYFCVSLALLDSRGSALALVYDPIHDECFTARRGEGAWLNGKPLAVAEGGEIASSIAEVDLKRLDSELAARVAAEHPFRSQRNLGAGALDWCSLAAGRFQLYLHGGQKLWDYSAGCLIFSEAGGYATTLDGEPVFVADSTVARSVVAAGGEALYREWYHWLQDE